MDRIVGFDHHLFAEMLTRISALPGKKSLLSAAYGEQNASPHSMHKISRRSSAEPDDPVRLLQLNDN
jgi:hypothetical protein